jgi:heat shock protein HtpX
MKRNAYGRDFGLSTRMLLTMFTLGLIYVVFFVVLLQLTSSILFVVVIMGALAFFQYFTSDKIALLASGAKVVGPDEAPQLHAMVERLAAMADLPKPRVAVIPSPVPNAFATGRNQKHSVVAVTQGLWDRLDEPEIEGVLAHELTHVANRDVAVMTIASFFSMVAAMLARFGLWGGMFSGGDRDRGGGAPAWLILFAVSLLTYVISWILIMMISRYREYAADRGAALITGAPENLMSALQKIASRMTQIPQQDLREVAGMNAFFIVPTNVKKATAELFMTHPPLEKRLARLADIAREMGKPVPVEL